MRGRILVGDHNGVYVLLFQGDVRLTLCTAVDSFLARMFEDPGFRSVIVDLSGTESIDSTSLGLLAKLSIEAQRRLGYRPTLISTDRDVTRILMTMGLEDVFNIVEEPLQHREQLDELACCAASEDDVRARVLEAHHILMSMNENNRVAFQDLVKTLEEDMPQLPLQRHASI